MPGPHKGVYQGDASAGLAAASSHDEEEAAALPFDAFHNRSNGLELKIAAGDGGVNQLIS